MSDCGTYGLLSFRVNNFIPLRDVILSGTRRWISDDPDLASAGDDVAYSIIRSNRWNILITDSTQFNSGFGSEELYNLLTDVESNDTFRGFSVEKHDSNSRIDKNSYLNGSNHLTANDKDHFPETMIIPFQIINHFPNTIVLTNRASMIRILNRQYSETSTHVFDLTPTTYYFSRAQMSNPENGVLHLFLQRFNALSEGKLDQADIRMPLRQCTRNMWIIKSASPNDSDSPPVIVNSASDITTFLKYAQTDCVVQKYIERPLLYGDRKTTVGLWLLATDSGDIFVYRDPFVYVAPFPYSQSTLRECPSTLDFTYSHCARRVYDMDELYNNPGNRPVDPTSRQDVSWSALQAEIDSTFAAGSLPAAALDDFVLPRMTQIAVDALRGALAQSGGVEAQWSGPLVAGITSENDGLPSGGILDGSRGRRSFQLLEAEFILDERLQPWLLAFHARPAITGPRHAASFGRLCEEVARVAIDPLFPCPYSDAVRSALRSDAGTDEFELRLQQAEVMSGPDALLPWHSHFQPELSSSSISSASPPLPLPPQLLVSLPPSVARSARDGEPLLQLQHRALAAADVETPAFTTALLDALKPASLPSDVSSMGAGSALSSGSGQRKLVLSKQTVMLLSARRHRARPLVCVPPAALQGPVIHVSLPPAVAESSHFVERAVQNSLQSETEQPSAPSDVKALSPATAEGRLSSSRLAAQMALSEEIFSVLGSPHAGLIDRYATGRAGAAVHLPSSSRADSDAVTGNVDTNASGSANSNANNNTVAGTESHGVGKGKTTSKSRLVKTRDGLLKSSKYDNVTSKISTGQVPVALRRPPPPPPPSNNNNSTISSSISSKESVPSFMSATKSARARSSETMTQYGQLLQQVHPPPTSTHSVTNSSNLGSTQNVSNDVTSSSEKTRLGRRSRASSSTRTAPSSRSSSLNRPPAAATPVAVIPDVSQLQHMSTVELQELQRTLESRGAPASVLNIIKALATLKASADKPHQPQSTVSDGNNVDTSTSDSIRNKAENAYYHSVYAVTNDSDEQGKESSTSPHQRPLSRLADQIPDNSGPFLHAPPPALISNLLSGMFKSVESSEVSGNSSSAAAAAPSLLQRLQQQQERDARSVGSEQRQQEEDEALELRLHEQQERLSPTRALAPVLPPSSLAQFTSASAFSSHAFPDRMGGSGEILGSSTFVPLSSGLESSGLGRTSLYGQSSPTRHISFQDSSQSLLGSLMAQERKPVNIFYNPQEKEEAVISEESKELRVPRDQQYYRSSLLASTPGGLQRPHSSLNELFPSLAAAPIGANKNHHVNKGEETDESEGKNKAVTSYLQATASSKTKRSPSRPYQPELSLSGNSNLIGPRLRNPSPIRPLSIDRSATRAPSLQTLSKEAGVMEAAPPHSGSTSTRLSLISSHGNADLLLAPRSGGDAVPASSSSLAQQTRPSSTTTSLLRSAVAGAAHGAAFSFSQPQIGTPGGPVISPMGLAGSFSETVSLLPKDSRISLLDSSSIDRGSLITSPSSAVNPGLSLRPAKTSLEVVSAPSARPGAALPSAAEPKSEVTPNEGMNESKAATNLYLTGSNTSNKETPSMSISVNFAGGKDSSVSKGWNISKLAAAASFAKVGKAAAIAGTALTTSSSSPSTSVQFGSGKQVVSRPAPANESLGIAHINEILGGTSISIATANATSTSDSNTRSPFRDSLPTADPGRERLSAAVRSSSHMMGRSLGLEAAYKQEADPEPRHVGSSKRQEVPHSRNQLSAGSLAALLNASSMSAVSNSVKETLRMPLSGPFTGPNFKVSNSPIVNPTKDDESTFSISPPRDNRNAYQNSTSASYALASALSRPSGPSSPQAKLQVNDPSAEKNKFVVPPTDIAIWRERLDPASGARHYYNTESQEVRTVAPSGRNVLIVPLPDSFT